MRAAERRARRLGGVLEHRDPALPGERAISSIGAGMPNRCTATIACVAGVSARSIVSRVMQNVSGSMSQKTGRAPVCGIASALA